MTYSDVVLIWGENESTGPAPAPTVSVSAWSDVTGLAWTRWDTGDIRNTPDNVRTAKVAIVNLFHTPDSIHIQQIKQVNPQCFVIACPDACIDLVLANPNWMNVHKQMALADMIGGRTTTDCNVYGTFFNKPTTYFPSPIGPTEWFVPFRDLPKEDYIITLDHSFGQPNTYLNVAVCAAVQRETGCRIVYASERAWTPQYAEIAGLKAEFVGHVPFADFVSLTARAKLCIDIYAAHSYGRQQVLCAMVGTPCVGSNYCKDAPHGDFNAYRITSLFSDPFYPAGAISDVWSLNEFPEFYKSIRNDLLVDVESRFSFTASRNRFEHLLNEIGVTA